MAVQTHRKRFGRVIFGLMACLLLALSAGVVQATPALAQEEAPIASEPTVVEAAAFDVSPALRDIAPRLPQQSRQAISPRLLEERGPVVPDRGYSGDGALQSSDPRQDATLLAPPIVNFEGLANTDNPFLLSPPDPVGDVGPNHYVEMVNVVFAVYSKTGTRLLGPIELGALWEGFAVNDCARNAGDPIVLYDQYVDRWLLSQFTTRGPEYFNCVAISQTGDPTGAYYRYAFSSGENFPDYPKYGVWRDAYYLSTREFGPTDVAGIGAYALERRSMVLGDPNARMVKFLLAPGNTRYLGGDGLLPADADGGRLPPPRTPNFFVGTMDDDGQYGAPFDAVNIFEFSVLWVARPVATFRLAAQLPVASFDSAFPCDFSVSSRACIPQPDTDHKIDILSYRQRPMWRLAYRNFITYETMVTNQSVEARPGIAGVRWYEIRRVNGEYSIHQQGTYAPDDVNRWMGSAAMDRAGNIGVGYSVSSKTVYPGIRYTGRLNGDLLGEMTLGEVVIINGSGSQLGPSSRWGDYTSMNIDPTDDCTFWYVNEYYETSSPRNWQTRIASFRLPGCTP
jgi:hypothetical protein